MVARVFIAFKLFLILRNPKSSCFSTLFFLVFLFWVNPAMLRAQDYQFTQFYASPLNLNPAFAGSDNTRFATNYRNQWSSLPNAFVTYNASIDHFFASANSGVGLRFTRDQFGSAGVGANAVGLTYAYEFQISNTFSVRPGVEFSFNQMSIDFTKMVFGDQLILGTPTSQTTLNLDRFTYADFAAGALIYSEKFWFGYSVHHLNEPLTSFRETGSRLPMRSSFHTGYEFTLQEGSKLARPIKLLAAANFRQQQEFSAFDLGFYLQPDPLIIGLWYRGVPIGALNGGNVFYDSMAILFGYNSEKYNVQFAYSYDITLSGLAANSGGSHEISMILTLFDEPAERAKRKSRVRKIPCPKF
jgi:type IX secretion system PorP/SprF family membrane protein